MNKLNPKSLNQFNLQTIRKIDSSIHSIVLAGGHVAAYSFDLDTFKWESLAVNGPLFLVESSSPTRYSILILNRATVKTLNFEIHPRWTLENTNLVLIYRPETQIYGLWFHDPILKDKFYHAILHLMSTLNTSLEFEDSADATGNSSLNYNPPSSGSCNNRETTANSNSNDSIESAQSLPLFMNFQPGRETPIDILALFQPPYSQAQHY